MHNSAITYVSYHRIMPFTKHSAYNCLYKMATPLQAASAAANIYSVVHRNGQLHLTITLANLTAIYTLVLITIERMMLHWSSALVSARDPD